MSSESYIEFSHQHDSTRKTQRWHVYAKQGHVFLGSIKWSAGWRCYAFYPWGETLYEHKCLREIADFVEFNTAEQRATWK